MDRKNLKVLGTEPLHCPQCGYDLRGQTLERCPECGFRYDRPGLEYLEEEALQRCLSPLVDAVNVLLVGILLSTIGLFPFILPSPYRMFLPQFLVLTLIGVWLLLFARGLLLDWILAEPPRVFETAKDTSGEFFTRHRLLAVWAVATFAQFLFVSEIFFLAINACLLLLGFGWTVLGITRIKDLPAREDRPALKACRASMLTRARRAAIILLFVDLLACGTFSALL